MKIHIHLYCFGFSLRLNWSCGVSYELLTLHAVLFVIWRYSTDAANGISKEKALLCERLFLYPSQFLWKYSLPFHPTPRCALSLSLLRQKQRGAPLFLKSRHQKQSKLLFLSRKYFVERRGIHIGMPSKLGFRQWGLGFRFLITNGSGNTLVPLLFPSHMPYDPFETSNVGSTWRYKGPFMHSHLNILISLSLFQLIYFFCLYLASSRFFFPCSIKATFLWILGPCSPLMTKIGIFVRYCIWSDSKKNQPQSERWQIQDKKPKIAFVRKFALMNGFEDRTTPPVSHLRVCVIISLGNSEWFSFPECSDV